MAKGYVVILLIAIIVGAIFYLYFMKDANATGLSAAITVTFTDGTTQTLGPTDNLLVPLTLEMGNPPKAVASITTNLYLTATYTGTMTSALTSGNVTLSRGKLGGPYTLITTSQISSGQTPVSGTALKVWTQTYSESYLQAGWTTIGSLVFQFNFKVDFAASFTSGSSDSESGTGWFQVATVWTPDSGITSLSITADFNPLYAV